MIGGLTHDISVASAFAHRDFNGTLDGPSMRAAKPRAKYFFGYPCVPREIGKRVSLASKFKENIANPIIGLLDLCCPSAVATLIIAVVIRVAIQRVSYAWTFAHVGEKVIEGSPLIRYCYATFLVMIIGVAGWLETARDHSLPCAVGWGASAPFSMPMPAMSTSTGFDFSHGSIIKRSQRPAIAFAVPTRVVEFIPSCVLKHGPVIEAQSRQVFNRRCKHGNLRSGGMPLAKAKVNLKWSGPWA